VKSGILTYRFTNDDALRWLQAGAPDGSLVVAMNKPPDAEEAAYMGQPSGRISGFQPYFPAANS
jgi:hypothetical protein